MTEHYEDTEDQRTRTLSNRQVFRFVAEFWRRQPLPLVGVLIGTLVLISLDLALPWVAGSLVDLVVAGPARAPEVWAIWGVFVAIYVAIAVVRNITYRIWSYFAARNMKAITDEGFARVQSFSADWHADNFAGATVRKLSRAMWGYDLISDAVVIWIGPALAVLVGLSIMMMLRWPVVGLFSLLVLALYIWANLFLTERFGRARNLRSVALDSRIGGAIADAISGNPTVRSFGAEDRELGRIQSITEAWRVAAIAAWNRFTDIWLVLNLLLALLQAGLTGLLIRLWSRGEASPGDVAFGITAFMLMYGYLGNIGENFRTLQKGMDDIEDTARFARMVPDVIDRPEAEAARAGQGEIVFEGATFGYKAAGHRLFEAFDLHISPGERIALVGTTGAGKSTFVKLLQRLYDLQAGRICIDGQDIAKVTQSSLRRAIAVVPQDPALFHRSIRDNLAYAKPNASQGQIEQAARQARAHDFINGLPEGYDTLVGERGVKLSGGERQRVAIARAFLADAPILVLDEATSSLDVETERDVQAAMEELMAGRTTIVIAHRLSTIRRADRILVFDKGRIVEEGDHAGLVAKGGTYARLHEVTMAHS